MNSLSQQIADLINPLPSLIDPEDDIHTETSAIHVLNTTTTHGIDGHNHLEDEGLSQSVLRRKTTENLSDINKRYSGIKVNREVLKHLDEDNDESDGNDGSDGSDSNSQDIELEDREDTEFYSDNIRAPTASSEDLDSGRNSNESEDEDEDHEFNDKHNSGDGSDEYINQFSNIDVNEDIAKGIALKNQLLVWDNLLECRINVQKILMDSNRCPQFDCLNHLRKGLDEKKLNYSVKQSKQSLNKLLKMLIDIDFALESQNSIILDEKHSSETNEHHIINEDKSVNINDLSGFVNKRKLSDSECCEYLSKRHCNLSSTRNHLLDKWYEKTRFTSNAFKNKSLVGLEQSSTQQIGRILSDMERLVRRTQTKRSLYSIIGKTDIDEKAINDNQLNVESIDKSDGNEVDAEIFDDDDFYHQLLRELIESKTGSQSNDPIILSKKWLEIQKLRNKIKRKVDTKASKGRKIRYDVHSKLVNFMAPINNDTFTESATNDLLNSLFGNNTNKINF